MPQSIEQLLKESRELIERSRQLRARSLQTMKQFVYLKRQSDLLSHNATEPLGHIPVEAKEIVRHLVDSRKE
jgi:hypothetical protein